MSPLHKVPCRVPMVVSKVELGYKVNPLEMWLVVVHLPSSQGNVTGHCWSGYCCTAWTQHIYYARDHVGSYNLLRPSDDCAVGSFLHLSSLSSLVSRLLHKTQVRISLEILGVECMYVISAAPAPAPPCRGILPGISR